MRNTYWGLLRTIRSFIQWERHQVPFVHLRILRVEGPLINEWLLAGFYWPENLMVGKAPLWDDAKSSYHWPLLIQTNKKSWILKECKRKYSFFSYLASNRKFQCSIQKLECKFIDIERLISSNGNIYSWITDAMTKILSKLAKVFSINQSEVKVTTQDVKNSGVGL